MRLPLGLALLLLPPLLAAQTPPQPAPEQKQPLASHWLTQGKQQQQAGHYQAAMVCFE